MSKDSIVAVIGDPHEDNPGGHNMKSYIIPSILLKMNHLRSALMIDLTTGCSIYAG